jgi:hypothetical protein
VKTSYDQLIAGFVNTKFESTEGMKFKKGGKRWIGKQANKVI